MFSPWGCSIHDWIWRMFFSEHLECSLPYFPTSKCIASSSKWFILIDIHLCWKGFLDNIVTKVHKDSRTFSARPQFRTVLGVKFKAIQYNLRLFCTFWGCSFGTLLNTKILSFECPNFPNYCHPAVSEMLISVSSLRKRLHVYLFVHLKKVLIKHATKLIVC